VKYVLGIWTLNILFAALQWTKINQAARGTHLVLWLVLLVSGATQIRILVIVRRNRRQLQAQLPASENRQRQREVKLANILSVIVGVSLISNFPVQTRRRPKTGRAKESGCNPALFSTI